MSAAVGRAWLPEAAEGDQRLPLGELPSSSPSTRRHCSVARALLPSPPRPLHPSFTFHTFWSCCRFGRRNDSRLRFTDCFASALLATPPVRAVMADSTMSDADKIRTKRLAKLGGTSNSGSSTPPTNGQSSTNGLQSQPTIPVAKPEAAVSVEAKNDATEPMDIDAPQQKAKPVAQEPKSTPPTATSVKRERDGSQRPRTVAKEKTPESLEVWQDRTLRGIFRVTLDPEELRDSNGNQLIFLAATKEDLAEQSQANRLHTDVLEGAITEAAGKAPGGKPFEYLLTCFKRVARAIRGAKVAGPEDPKHAILKEARRLCMSYCVFAVTMPEMFNEAAASSNPLVDHLLADPECDVGICSDFLDEASMRFEEDETIKEAVVGAAEELSRRLSQMDMLADYQNYIRGLRNLVRYPKIVDAITQSPMWAPDDVAPQEIETKTLLGPFFRISPMQIEVARSYFSAPKTRDRGFIANAQNAVRMTLRTHQSELFQLADAIVRSGPAIRERMLNWFALCVNKNHKKRAMRVDYRTVSSDGFMVNVTIVLDQLCEPFMDARFGKIDRIDVDYLRRSPRVDISDETKINVDQKGSDEFFSHKADGTSNFITEVFFLTVAAHHYGTEAAQTRMSTLRKSVKRYEGDLANLEAERHKYVNDPRYLARFEQAVDKYKKQIDDDWSTIHATTGVLLDDLNQARSMQFMRYVIVWLLRLASRLDIPTQPVQLPLPTEQPDVFRTLPEYFLEDIVDNFKFITSNIPHIITPQQCEEILQICITFLSNSEYVKNPGVKSGLVTILYYGSQPYHNHSRGILGDLLIGSPFAHKHLLHALVKFYIEAESTGTHTQFYDKFNIRYEIFEIIKKIWDNTMYRDNLAREAQVNTDFFVHFVNLLVNDVTYVLDESLSRFAKIRDLEKEIESPNFNALDEEQRKEKMDLLEEQKSTVKNYMFLTNSSMEALKLFTETLADSFTMPEIVQRLADMLDYNLNTMVGKGVRSNLAVHNPQEYGFNPVGLLSDIVAIFINLAGKHRFVEAIAKDGRSYKPENFSEAKDILTKKISKSPEELRVWQTLADNVAESKALADQEEEDLGEVPDEFLDPLLSDIMTDPVILPSSRQTVDRATIRSHLLSDPTDPFNRVPLKIEEVIPDTEMKSKIEAWKAERKAAKKAEKEADRMDVS